MAGDFTLVNLDDVPDDAVKDGFDARWTARRWRTPLGTSQTGVTHYHLKPGMRSPISHRHAEAEEIFIVLSGSGSIKLDDELIELGKNDAIRVAPHLWRAFDAGPEGLEILATGPYLPDDGERRDDPWVG